MEVFASELVGNFEHKPTTFLRNELGVHATAVVFRVKEIAHIESNGYFAHLIFCSDVEDGTGFHVGLENESFLGLYE